MKVSRILSATLIVGTLVLGGCTESKDKKNGAAPTPTPPPATKPEMPPVSENGLIRSDYAAGEITAQCDAAIAVTEAELQAIGAVEASVRAVDTTLLRFEKAMAEFNDVTTPLTFMGYVSTNEALRNEGAACEEKLGAFYVGVFTRRNLYEAIKGVTTNDAAEARLLAETVEGFENEGLKLDEAQLSSVRTMKSDLSKKEAEFSANLNNDVTKTEYTEAELAGVPADALARWPNVVNADGVKVYTVDTKGSTYTVVMENALNAETRRKMLLAWENRAAAANSVLITEAVALRQQIATALGYKTWAGYRTATRMAATEDNVRTFLNDLKGKLSQKNAADYAQMLAYKKELDPTATVVNQWDVAFLSNGLKKRDYTLDTEKVREYFPTDKVIAGMFSVYEKLLGVKYQEIQNPTVWNNDVKLYAVLNPANNEIRAYFYADFVPRDGKYGHAAAFTLRSGRLVNNKYNIPVSSIVANFTPPSAGKPSLMTHDEVETTFHEFGHIMHQILTTAPYASLSGTSVARDFVEAPSQMLENWVWDASILPMISGHYETGAPIPADLLAKMLSVKDFQLGRFYTRQLVFGLFDLSIHTKEGAVDVVQTYIDTYRDVVGQEPIQGTNFPATFGHMMGGYDAGYYGYLWSEVYAQDMFSKFETAGLLDEATGLSYRDIILARGGMEESIDLLRQFLGREPNSDAFFKKLGVQ